jgi:beta-glucosidase
VDRAPYGLDFPAGFLWGTATAAHQIEGANVNNDWWDWEHDASSPCVASSGDACDSWHRGLEDVGLVASLGLGAYRFSLEWSRIEPAEGEWSLAALDHYRRQCAALVEAGLVPVVTFHHFTSPRWFARRGGWEAPDAAERFGRFVERATAHLGDLIGWACTINEPNVVAVLGYVSGQYPPGIRGDLDRCRAVMATLIAAHHRAVEALRSGPGRFPVGLTLSMEELVAGEGGAATRDAAEELTEDTFLHATAGDDFVGVQCYERTVLGPGGRVDPGPGTRLTQMGYEYWPRVVEHTARRAAAVSGLPVVVTENGIATEDDAERIEFLSEALASLHRCLSEGVDVRGYFVWSLLDNFEWTHGFGPKLGLCAVDPVTFERRPKPSARWFGAVARANRLVTAPPTPGGGGAGGRR